MWWSLYIRSRLQVSPITMTQGTDIVERFHLGMLTVMIAWRNYMEFSGSLEEVSPLPMSFFPYLPYASMIATIISPIIIVLGSELLVDILKHSFITKFNRLKPSIYRKIGDLLCYDYGREFCIDPSEGFSRRVGLSTYPLACLTIKIIIQTLNGRRIAKYSSALGFYYINSYVDHVRSFMWYPWTQFIFSLLAYFVG